MPVTPRIQGGVTSTARYGVFVWDADGDMGDAVLLGPTHQIDKAEATAERIRRGSERAGDDTFRVEAMVIPLLNTDTSVANVIARVTGQSS